MNTEKIIFTDTIFSLSSFEHGGKACMKLVWTPESGDLTDEDYRAHVEIYLQTIQKFHFEKVLIDTTNFLYIIPPDTQDWLNQYIFPLTIEAGLKRMAILLSSDFYAQLSVELAMEENPSLGFSNKFFEDTNTALEWL
jgi:hypothetical protein